MSKFSGEACPQTPLATGVSGVRLACLPTHKFLVAAMIYASGFHNQPPSVSAWELFISHQQTISIKSLFPTLALQEKESWCLHHLCHRMADCTLLVLWVMCLLWIPKMVSSSGSFNQKAQAFGLHPSWQQMGSCLLAALILMCMLLTAVMGV